MPTACATENATATAAAEGTPEARKAELFGRYAVNLEFTLFNTGAPAPALAISAFKKL